MTLPELLLEFGAEEKGGNLSKAQSDELLEWMQSGYGKS